MAGKGFTVKKDWDNPLEHSMPEQVRVPAEFRIGEYPGAPGDRAGTDGGSYGYGFSPVYPECQPVYYR